MIRYRTEIRVFGLVLIALIATVVLHFGIVSAKMDGALMGIKFSVAGPAVLFIVILLVFHMTGLFKLGLEKQEEVSDSPVESLSRDEIENQLDRIEISGRRLDRRKKRLKAALLALEQDRSAVEVIEAAGLRPVSRPGRG
jgi:hypothetical protein